MASLEAMVLKRVAPLTQKRVAEAIGVEPTNFSRFLNNSGRDFRVAAGQPVIPRSARHDHDAALFLSRRMQALHYRVVLGVHRQHGEREGPIWPIPPKSGYPERRLILHPDPVPH